MIEPPLTVLSAFTGTWRHPSPASTPAWKSAARYPPPETAMATLGGRMAPESGLGGLCGQLAAAADVQSRRAARRITKLSAAVRTSHQLATKVSAMAVDAPVVLGQRSAGPRPRRGPTRAQAAENSATM